MTVSTRLLKKTGCYSLLVSVLSGYSYQLSAAEIEAGYGLGWDDNILYSETNEQDEFFGHLNLGYKNTLEFENANRQLEFDVIYEDSHFNSESNARDKFFSGFTEFTQQHEQFSWGASIDPQYSQSVTSDTDGGLIIPGKQRSTTIKTRLFSEFELDQNSSVEAGVTFKEKNYKDTDSDYDSVIFDLVMRSSFSDQLRVALGATLENRDYDSRSAKTSTGTDIAGEELQIERNTVFVRGSYKHNDRLRYTAKLSYRDNSDEEQDFYSHNKIKLKLKGEYRWPNDTTLEVAYKQSRKDFDKQLADNGSSLDDDKYAFEVALDFPLEEYFNVSQLNNWYGLIEFEHETFDSGISTQDYNRNRLLFTLHTTF